MVSNKMKTSIVWPGSYHASIPGHVLILMGILLSFILQGKASSLSAIVGQEVVLTCDIKVNGPDETYEWKRGTSINDSVRLAFTFGGQEPVCDKEKCTLRANGDLIFHEVTETDFEQKYFCVRGNENYYAEHSLNLLEVPSCEVLRPQESAFIINPKKQEYKNGTSVTFSCLEGYYLDGISNSVCLLGQWNPSISATNCIASSCQAPAIIDENLRIIKQERDDYKNGSYVQFTCPADYDLYGNSSSLCLNGDWKPPAFPVCAASPVVVISPWREIAIIVVVIVLLCIIKGIISWYRQRDKKKIQEGKKSNMEMGKTSHGDYQKVPTENSGTGDLQSDRGNPVRSDSKRVTDGSPNKKKSGAHPKTISGDDQIDSSDHVKPPRGTEIKQLHIHDDSEIKLDIFPVGPQSSLGGIVIGCHPGENLNISTNHDQMEAPAPKLGLDPNNDVVSMCVTDETSVPVVIKCLKCGICGCTLHIYGGKQNEKKHLSESSEDDPS